MVIESKGSAAGVVVTVTFAVAVTTMAGVVAVAAWSMNSAVMVDEPALTPLTRPGGSGVHILTGGVALLRAQVCVCPAPVPGNELTVAMVGLLEVHTICGEAVTSSCRPVLQIGRA